MKKFISFMLVLYLFIPVSVFAYSDYVMASGKNIGIELKSDYVLVVGSYDINNHNFILYPSIQTLHIFYIHYKDNYLFHHILF